MADEQYFVIYLSEDGDGRIVCHDKDDLLSRIKTDWGNAEQISVTPTKGVYIGEQAGIIIIKGTQVFPTPRQIIEAWDIA